MKKTVVLLSLLFSLTSCATFQELYNWFGLSVPLNVDGTLLARESRGGAANDKPLFSCHKQGSCIVVESPEFFKIQGDYNKLLNQLRECQGR